MTSSISTPYTGIFPVAPTIFHEDGALDIEGQRRVMDLMVDQGNDGLCVLANYSEQFVLSDSERDLLIEECLKKIDDRVPVIVTCSHYSTAIAVERAKRAEAGGAKMLMMMPPYHGATLKADENGIFEHFSQIANAISIPVMVQDAPLAGVTLSVPFLEKLAREIPLLSYFKIEMPGTAAKLRALIVAVGDHIDGPFDGEEAITLMADLDAGATGTMTSALMPDLIRPVVIDYLAGKRDAAMAQYNKVLPLINFENRQCGLRAAKAVMKEGGVIKSDAVRHPQEALHPATRKQLLELARTLNPLALSWGK
jgi:2-keto-3-deoxy-L-arabinonate dehydratase